MKDVTKQTLTYPWLNIWTILSLLIFVLVVTPMGTIVIQLFHESGPQWVYISKRLLTHYFPSTIFLLTGVAIVSLVLGISSAWIVSVYDFPGRKIFEWLLILPLSFPAYIMGYSYVGVLEYTGPTHAFLRNSLGWQLSGPLLDIMNIWGAIMILSFSLFPYLYVVCRTSFLNRSRDLLDVAALSGNSEAKRFWKISLPMARPAIVGGLALISMEVLNDYGTVKYFGVDTFTTGIFRSWFSLGDLSTGVRLSSILMLFVITMLWIEKGQRGRRAFSGKTGMYRPAYRRQLKGSNSILVSCFCLALSAFTFIIPLSQLIYWTFLTAHKVLNNDFWQLALNSFLLSFFSAVIIVIMSTVLAYSVRVNRITWIQHLSQLSTLGYAIPGAIIAIGIYIPVVRLDQFISGMFMENGGLYLSQTVFLLVFAYIVRFMAVGYNTMYAGFQRVGPHIAEASRTLGASDIRTFFKIDVPTIKNSLIASLLLVFVDTIKELPLSLILRPFNFHTLATKAFDMATNEQIAESANAALLIILIGIVPVIMLSRQMNKN